MTFRRLAALGLVALGVSAARPAPAALIIGLTTNNELVTFDSAAPGTVLSTVAISGASNLVGIDTRPANGQLYGVSTTDGGRLYRIDRATGIATAVGGPFAVALSGDGFGIDFNPVVDRLRVVSTSGQNFRVNPITGAVVNGAADTALTFDPSTGVPAGTVPAAAATAYSNSLGLDSPRTPPPGTTQYTIDTSLDRLFIQGAVNPPGPNGGVLTDPGGVAAPLGFDASPNLTFDIGRGNVAFLYDVADNQFRTISLATGGTLTSTAYGDGNSRLVAITAAAVPEPAGLALVGVAAAGLVGRQLRRKA